MSNLPLILMMPWHLALIDALDGFCEYVEEYYAEHCYSMPLFWWFEQIQWLRTLKHVLGNVNSKLTQS